MALEKQVKVDKIECVGDFSIQVRTATKVLDGEKQIGGTSYHRHVIHPSSSLEGQDEKVVKIANALFTDEIKKAWADKQAEEL